MTMYEMLACLYEMCFWRYEIKSEFSVMFSGKMINFAKFLFVCEKQTNCIKSSKTSANKKIVTTKKTNKRFFI